jgi:hypothetical protein
LEVGDPFSLVEIGGVVNLEFLVDWRHLGLDCVLVLSVDESKSGVLAGIRGVHNEYKFGFLSAVLGVVLKVVDSVSWFISWDCSFEGVE